MPANGKRCLIAIYESRITPLPIHGRYDRVISRPEKVQHYLDGGHLIAMTHAQECVTYLREAWF